MLKLAKLVLEKYERRISGFAFVFGFVWDNLTLTRIDSLLDDIILGSYLLMALFSIVLISAHHIGKLTGSFGQRIVSFAHFLLPFAFGGLFSGFLIFYSRSGAVLASWPFFLILGALFFCNEFLRRNYERFVFQMGVFFVTLFSYTALIVPVILGEMGGVIFVASGVISLVVFWLALRGVALFAREQVEHSRYSLYVLVTIIFITFNFLYFNNMIPPIPLSLTDIGIYHAIERTRAGEYRLTFEKAPWYAFGKKTNAIFHRVGNAPAYVWSSVFAPTRLDTEVQHRWSYYSAGGGFASGGDESKGKWVSSSVVGFPISGGRSDGYRGYSTKANLFPGKWRVDVETLRGQIIGRFVFTVENADIPAPLKTETR